MGRSSIVAALAGIALMIAVCAVLASNELMGHRRANATELHSGMPLSGMAARRASPYQLGRRQRHWHRAEMPTAVHSERILRFAAGTAQRPGKDGLRAPSFLTEASVSSCIVCPMLSDETARCGRAEWRRRYLDTAAKANTAVHNTSVLPRVAVYRCRADLGDACGGPRADVCTLTCTQRSRSVGGKARASGTV